jgi:hypothetical protein
VGFLAVGYFWLLALPLSHLGTDTYVDENALQPSQVPYLAFFPFMLIIFAYRLTLIGTGEMLTVPIRFLGT